MIYFQSTMSKVNGAAEKDDQDADEEAPNARTLRTKTLNLKRLVEYSKFDLKCFFSCAFPDYFLSYRGCKKDK